jgi:hypothetical protein
MGNIMKNISLKNKFVVALLLATVGYSSIATAFSMGGSKTKIRLTKSTAPPPSPPPGAFAVSRTEALGTDASATDVWTVSCPATTEGLETKVMDLDSSEPLVSVQTIKGIKATNSTDPNNKDTAYGPLVKNTDRPGQFYVLVDKSSAGAVSYTISIECKGAKNVSLSPSAGPNLTQNN